MTFKTTIKWEEEIPMLISFVENGTTLQTIGDYYGVTRERIRQVLRKYNIPNGRNIRRKKREAARYKKHGDKSQSDYQIKKLKFSSKRANAGRVGAEFTIGFGDLNWPSHCPVLGIPLDYYADRRQENSPSIDQIDPSKGYVPGNVAVISWRANRIKNDGTLEEHEKIVTWLEKVLHTK